MFFFAKPYHSWGRGANENTNGLYRQHIPKGTDFQALDKDILPTARLMLNTRPRKRLNYISPIQEIYRIFASDCKLINIVNKVAFESYETIGGLFAEVTCQTVEMSIVDKIWLLIVEVVTSIAEQISADYDELMESAIHGNKHLAVMFAPFLSLPSAA